MNILFDTNIILDLLQKREPFSDNAMKLFNAVESSTINGFICANSICTIAYLLQRHQNKQFAVTHIELLLELFEIAPVNRSTIQEALTAKFSDFEDAIIYKSALHVNANGIVTRNPKDFKQATINIYQPKELLAALTPNDQQKAPKKTKF